MTIFSTSSFSWILCGLLVFFGGAAVAAGPTPGLSVVVTNTPLPVTGTVNATFTGTPTVSATISGTPTVKIAGETLYQQRFEFSGSVVGHCSNTQGSIDVPSGKVLIIESVYVAGASTNGSPIFGVLQVLWNNVNHGFRFSPPLVGVDGELGQDQYNGTFATKILAEARTSSILVDGCSFGPLQAGSQAIEVVLSGHYVDAQ